MNTMAWRGEFLGERMQLPSVRRLAAALLTDCLVRDDTIACVVELASNAILHTRSAGGSFTVGIWSCRTTARVAVKDAGGAHEPTIRTAHLGELAEHGRGLAIVGALCVRLGVAGGEDGRIVWAEISCDRTSTGLAPAEMPLPEEFCECRWGPTDRRSRIIFPDTSAER